VLPLARLFVEALVREGKIGGAERNVPNFFAFFPTYQKHFRGERLVMPAFGQGKCVGVYGRQGKCVGVYGRQGKCVRMYGRQGKFDKCTRNTSSTLGFGKQKAALICKYK
jgi:hypothetical protein